MKFHLWESKAPSLWRLKFILNGYETDPKCIYCGIKKDYTLSHEICKVRVMREALE